MTYFQISLSILFCGVFHYIVGILFPFICEWDMRTSHLTVSQENTVSLIPYLTTNSDSSLWRFFSYYVFYSLSFYWHFTFAIYIHILQKIDFFILWWEAQVMSLFNCKYSIHSAQLMVRLSFVHGFAWSFVTVLCLQRHMCRFSASIVCLCM